MKKLALLILCATLALCLSLGVYILVKNWPSPPPSDPPSESFAATPTAPVTCKDNLDPAAYPDGTPVGDWLASSSGADRDEQLNAYVLCHTAAAGESTTYTYLVYYRHGGAGLSATAHLMEGDGGSRRVDVTYTAGGGRDGASLTYLQLTLPTGKEPRLRLIGTDGDTVGVLMTMTESEIPAP